MKWVNHASYVLATERFSLITDPWLFGSAFNNGWDLLSPSKFTVQDFSGINYIWISHEHPDHFAPAVLKAIPAEARPNIAVLFQETRDKKVLQFCRQLNFRTIELPLTRPISIDGRFQVLCGRMDDDSWLLLETDGLRILNLNDCVVKTEASAAAIRKRTGTVDVLLSQFGYAQWIGNPEETQLREHAAAEKMTRLKYQAHVLEPRYLVPFASYVFFSHEENAYLNDHLGNIREIVEFLRSETSTIPVALYPGDRWEIGTPWDNSAALDAYENDYRRDKQPLRTSPPVAEADLIELARNYVQRVREKNDVRLALFLERVMPGSLSRQVRIFLWDLKRTVLFDLRTGLEFLENGGSVLDAEMSSESLAYVLRFDWGIDTLQVNGRFRATPEGMRRLFSTFSLARLNNFGERFDIRHVLRRAVSKSKRLLLRRSV